MPPPTPGATAPGPRSPATSAPLGFFPPSVSTTVSRTWSPERQTSLFLATTTAQEPVMNERSKLQDLVGPHDSTRMLDALKRGASRRDVLAMLMAGGMQATLAGGLSTLALSAHAATPKRGGRIRVAGATAAITDTLDPAK